MIYFIQDKDGEGPIKIGKAKDVSRRLGQHQGMTSKRLVVLGVIDGYTRKEREIHNKFNHLRIGERELFEPASDLLEFIANHSKMIAIKYRKSVGIENPMINIGVRMDDELTFKVRQKAGMIPLSKIIRRLLEKWLSGEISLD